MLAGKVIIITGAASGIGRATAVMASGQGARLVLADIDANGASEVARICAGESLALVCDVSSSVDVQAMVAATMDHFGRLDGAFNNAGVAQPATTTVDCDEGVFDGVMAVNAKGTWLCLKYQIPMMLKSGGGSIVVNASLAGIRANPRTPAYIASKHAAVALAQGAALEYASMGMRINSVCPGLIHTSMMHDYLESIGADEETAVRLSLPGRWGTAEEVAQAVCWLLSDASSLINGVSLPVDGGKFAA